MKRVDRTMGNRMVVGASMSFQESIQSPKLQIQQAHFPRAFAVFFFGFGKNNCNSVGSTMCLGWTVPLPCRHFTYSHSLQLRRINAKQ